MNKSLQVSERETDLGVLPMKVSAVIATYNRGYIIREAIESVLAQTYRDFEIVVVDDGSTDNTSEIVESFQNEKIRYIRHERNQGCSAACNTGISAATGQLVGFLDSDDVWKSDYLERQVRFLTEHSEVDVVFCDTEILGDSTDVSSLTGLLRCFPKLLQSKPDIGEYVITGREMYVCLLEEVPIKPSAAVIRREMFAKAGVFDESWPSGTDWDLFLRFSRSACFGYVGSPLVIQRRTADATHLKFREKDKLFLLGVFRKEKATLQNDPEALAAVNRGIASHCNNLAGDYLYSRQRKKSFAVYVEGFKETRKPMMLMRAASIFLPIRVRDLIRTKVKRD